MILLMVSNGLLTTLLTLRADGLGFSDSAIGLVQSGYPVGALLGCLIAPGLIMRVGHVRIFAALASIASAAALMHLVTTDPWSWGAMRLLAGFCFSGLYIVAESWLNSSADNDNRGSLLSIYFVVQTGGVALGQLLLNVSNPDGILLFVVVSILISFSLVPMLVSEDATPHYEVPERVAFIDLFRLSPMGLTGSFLNGISQTTLYVALALYGSALGMSKGAIGGLIGSMTLGGMLFQFPLGKLSDMMDRRWLIAGIPAVSIPVCIVLASLDNPTDNLYLVYLMVALLGGLTLPVYSICMAHMNDHLNRSQVVAASGTLVLILAAGMTLGPTLGGFAIDHFGPTGIFHLLSLTAGLTVMTALFRLWSSPAITENRGNAVAVSANLTPEAATLYPRSSEKPAGGDRS
ncbi:MFS transporter [Granulosicoccus sp. 3-233]|uniref:MFS transporter n=1 Tax=Granulosicoccus sp. 3-233 TaxID=3417969 RepID=UPI003D34AC4F